MPFLVFSELIYSFLPTTRLNKKRIFFNRRITSCFKAVTWKMSFNVERHIRLLDVIKNSNPKLRNAIIECAEPELINAISEICYNFLWGNITCTKKRYGQRSYLIACCSSKFIFWVNCDNSPLQTKHLDEYVIKLWCFGRHLRRFNFLFFHN